MTPKAAGDRTNTSIEVLEYHAKTEFQWEIVKKRFSMSINKYYERKLHDLKWKMS